MSSTEEMEKMMVALRYSNKAAFNKVKKGKHKFSDTIMKKLNGKKS